MNIELLLWVLLGALILLSGALLGWLGASRMVPVAASSPPCRSVVRNVHVWPRQDRETERQVAARIAAQVRLAQARE